MNERGQKAKHTVERRNRALQLLRARRLNRQIPLDTPLRQALHWRRTIACAVSQLGKRRLERVVWPWQLRSDFPIMLDERPGRGRRIARALAPELRVKRGRARNPTARP